ncbi:polysaccharide biosynthesis/export family protein [Celeribacter indicus]|nr:polysaccharide biosynthesis/export family protein [Celeribacter indicus]SDX10922.1 polysaccharide export outer membrane protein [Celeribacter indicus]
MLFLLGLTLAGCEGGHVSFPVSETKQADLPPEIEVIRLSRENIDAYTQPEIAPKTDFVPQAQVWNYQVGVGDVLNIEVFDHPELRLPPVEGNSEAEPGFRVQANGTIYYPYVGEVPAAGRTPDHIREDLTERLTEYIPTPELQVRMSGFNSQSVIVSGEVKAPNTQPLRATPLTVLAAINAAGGFTENGDLSRVKLQRGGRTYNINLALFMSGSGPRHNPILVANDVISVPRRPTREAYLLGQIADPAPVDLSIEPINLTQAITRQGGVDERRADARGVFIFRNKQSGEGITVFQLEIGSPAGLLLGTEFMLASNDVIYITRAPVSKWNDVISQLLPSIGFGRTIETVVGE